MENININKDKWEEQKNEYGKKMDSGKNFIPESRGIIIQMKDTLKSSLNPLTQAKADPWDLGKGMYDTSILAPPLHDKTSKL